MEPPRRPGGRPRRLASGQRAGAAWRRGVPLDLELIADAIEEPPRFRSPVMGGVRHAEALRTAGVGVRALLALEMLGYSSDAPDS